MYLLRSRALHTVSPRWRHIDLETNDREYCTVASSHRVRNIKLLAETDPKRIFSRDDYCRFEKEEIYPGARNTRIDTRLHGTRTCPGNKTHTHTRTHAHINARNISNNIPRKKKYFGWCKEFGTLLCTDNTRILIKCNYYAISILT